MYENNLRVALAAAEGRVYWHGTILDDEPGLYDGKAVACAKQYHPQAFAEIAIIKILMEYVKNPNSCKIDNFVYN